MTPLKISALFFVLHLAITIELATGAEMAFILNSTKVEDRDMMCSIDGNGDDSQIEGIIRIDIFGILENSDERLATVNVVSPNIVKPGKEQIMQSFGNISGKDGFLRLKMKSDKRFLKYACRAMVLDEDLNHITMEKLQINKANVLMSMLNQRFAGIASGVDFNEAFQKLEDKFTDTRNTMSDEIKMEIARSVNITKETVSAGFEKVQANEDKAKNVIEKVADIEDSVKSIEMKLFEKMDSMSVLLETLVSQSTTSAQSGFDAKSCDDLRNKIPVLFRLSRVTITNAAEKPVMCDPATNGGGWTVFQRRINGDVNFNRTWNDYENGFGSFDSSFWMGLGPLSSLVAKGQWELRVDLLYKGKLYFAEYDNFKIGDSSTNYKLSLSGYSGTAGDSLAYHNGMSFSTPDRDNDKDSSNCAQYRSAAWWYNSCDLSSLNGQWGSKENDKGINWNRITTFSDSASFTEMKVRRVE